jgi:hypothetical protein
MTPAEYQSQRAGLKARERVLAAKLTERLQGAEVRDELFEYLWTRRELAKERLTKELSEGVQGAAAELNDLMDLFKAK